MAEEEAAGAAEETVCTFLRAVATGGTLGASEVFGAARLRRAPEEGGGERNQRGRNRETAFKPKSHENADVEP